MIRHVMCGFAVLVVVWLGIGVSEAKKRDRVRCEVHDVIAMPDGQFAVLLRTSDDPTRILPIWIGQTEAMAIRMRLDRQKPPRPLTLNLLESVLGSANIKLLEVKVDSLKGGVFLGKLRLKQSSRVWEIDARPSDAIGLAVGKGATIWVAREVLDEAGMSGEDLNRPDPGETRKGVELEESPKTHFEETL